MNHPTRIYQHVSSQLFDNLPGEYDIAGSVPQWITDLPPSDHPNALYTYLRERIGGIILAVEYIDALGWYEHTSDWDIRWGVLLKDGTGYGELATTPEDTPSDAYTEVIAVEFASQLIFEAPTINHIPFIRKPDIPSHQRFTHIRLTLNHYDENSEMKDSTVDVHINQISKISVTRL